MNPADAEILGLCRQAPFCPAPLRVAPSSWMSHIPFAFWLIELLRPAMLVELGSYHGVSFCAFCQALERLSLSCQAYAVDLWQGDEHMGAYGEEVHADLAAYVAAHYSGFACLLRCSFDAALPQFEDASIDLLHLDGCHAGEAILHDFNAWLPKMSSRGVVLVHDVCARMPGYGGVAAWRDISSQFPAFAFSHGYGLGVALIGPDAPVQLKELAALDDSGQARVRHLFQEQGKIYETLFALEARRDREAVVAKVIQEDTEKRFRAAIGEQREALEKLVAGEREQRAKEQCDMERLKEDLLAAELKAQAYAASISWKITAPLRKVAKWCRS